MAYNNPLLEIIAAGYNLTAGDENNMSISIKNIGGTNAYDVKASLTVPSTVSGISIVKGSSAVFKTINRGETEWIHPILYVASNCPLGAYSLTLSLEYTDVHEETYVDSAQIGVIVDAAKPGEPLLEINVTGYSLTAGGETEMNISIENIGKTTAYDVEATLTTPSTASGISIVKGSYARFGEIYYEETQWMYPVLYVSSDCPLGAYSLTLELEYTDASDKTYADSVQIGVVVDAVKPAEVDLSVAVKDYHVTAGTENEINITITNIGKEAVYDVEAVLSSISLSIVVLKELSYLFDEIDVVDSVSFGPLLAISQDVSLGAYSLTLTLDYKDSKGVTYRDEVAVGLFVGSVFSHTLAFKAQVEGYRITAGAENTIEVTLSNVGDTVVSDVNVQLSSATSHISVLKEISNTFHMIETNQSVYFTPTLGVSRNTPRGAYSLSLTLKYKDPDGVSYSDSLVIGLLVDSVEPTERTRIAVQNFQVTPTKIFPSDELMVEMDLKNWGANAYDVQVQLSIDSQSPFVSLGAALVFVGDLGSNQTKKVAYNLRVSGDADASLYALQMAISYYDVDDQTNSMTEAISISVHSIVDFHLLDIQPSIITAKPGETVTIEADLLLLGTETVDFVEVKIVENRSIGPFISVPQSYEYIGRVDPDSPVLFTIQFMVDPNATSGSYTVQLSVDCWDGYNQQRQVTIKLPVAVEELSNQNQETSPTLWEIIWTIIRISFGLKP
jgi:hypothetical protein